MTKVNSALNAFPFTKLFFLFLAQIDALPAIVKQVNGRCEVFLDGGVTKGTDVLKALALGAKMVGYICYSVFQDFVSFDIDQ